MTYSFSIARQKAMRGHSFFLESFYIIIQGKKRSQILSNFDLMRINFHIIIIDCLSCTPWAPKISKMLQLSKLLQLFEDEFWICSSLLGPQKSIYPVTAQTCSVDPYTLSSQHNKKILKTSK